MRYKQYLNENKFSTILSLEESCNWIKKNGKIFFNKCIENKTFIFRGIENYEDDYQLIKPNLKRSSANTYNFYTVIINEHSSWKKFPKRSTICTFNPWKAMDYGRNYYVFLKDNVNIGLCPEDDLWESFTNIIDAGKFNNILTNIFNNANAYINIHNLNDLKKSCKLVDLKIKENENYLNLFDLEYITYLKYNHKSFYDYLLEIFSPIKFEIVNSKNIDIKKYKNKESECWIDTECVLININDFQLNKHKIYKCINDI